MSDRWWSPQTVLNLLLAVFTAGVWVATLQYADTSKKAQRPWVYLAGLNVAQTTNASCSKDGCKYTLVADQPINIGMSYRNYGNSPVLRHGTDSQAFIGPKPPTDFAQWPSTVVPDYDCLSLAKSRNYGALFPGTTITLNQLDNPTELSISKPDFDAILAGTKGLYFSACIYYVDMWGKEHVTTLCSYLRHPDGIPSGSFAQCLIETIVN
jgi:hypothetical protein